MEDDYFFGWVQYLINERILTEEELYTLWCEYWDETEKGNFVFPMETLDFQLEPYTKREIVKMLKFPSSFNPSDKWGYIEFQFPHDRLSSSQYLSFCVDWKDVMKWIVSGHRDVCSDALWNIYKSYKRNDS